MTIKTIPDALLSVLAEPEPMKKNKLILDILQTILGAGLYGMARGDVKMVMRPQLLADEKFLVVKNEETENCFKSFGPAKDRAAKMAQADRPYVYRVMVPIWDCVVPSGYDG